MATTKKTEETPKDKRAPTATHSAIRQAVLDLMNKMAARDDHIAKVAEHQRGAEEATRAVDVHLEALQGVEGMPAIGERPLALTRIKRGYVVMVGRDEQGNAVVTPMKTV